MPAYIRIRAMRKRFIPPHSSASKCSSATNYSRRGIEALHHRVAYHFGELVHAGVDEGRTLDEAVRWARAADDEWEIAEASHGKVPAASSIADLRGRVERAASLLSDVGNP
jgi:hypothetical protein